MQQNAPPGHSSVRLSKRQGNPSWFAWIGTTPSTSLSRLTGPRRSGCFPRSTAAMHYPIEFRIVSYCQSRDTRENALRFTGNFFNVCNNAVDSLCTRPFGDVVLTWKQVGRSGKAAALAQLGACVIVDDNNAVLKECRTAGALGIGRQSGALRRAGRAPRIPQPASTPAPSCQSARPIRDPQGSWPPPPICKGRPRTFSLIWQRRRLQAAAQAQQVHRFPTPVVI